MKLKYNDIKLEIRKLGLTQREVADMLGITTQTLDYRIAKSNQLFIGQSMVLLITMVIWMII